MKENSIFNQLMSLISKQELNKIFRSHGSDKYVKSFSSLQHFTVLFLTQIKGLSSLRSIITNLETRKNKWYHFGLKSISKSNLSDANNKRPHEAYRTIFLHLLSKFSCLPNKHRFKFKSNFLSIDATTISLSLSLFPWAKFRSRKGGVKVHTLFNNAGYIPEFLTITPASNHDVTEARNLCKNVEKGSILAFDRGYIDFKWFYELTMSEMFFITRAKKNIKYKVVKRNSKNTKKGIKIDHIIKLTGYYKKKDYPGELRLIKYRNSEDGKVYTYLTNHFDLSASTIAKCYKERWQIELFFKWVKQNLKIKSFIGTSENAVMIQIWTAMIYYLLLAYLKKVNDIPFSMLKITRILKEKIFDLGNLLELFKPKPEKMYINLQTELIFTGH